MTCGGSSVVIDGEEEREDFKAMELYLESPFNVDVDIMPPSEVEKLFQAFAEERKRALPQFTPDGIPITLENKFDDAIYNYLYAYWKEQSGEYDPKKDVIPESEMNKMHPKTKNEKKFEQWLLQQYGMTNKEQREYTVKGNLESLWEIFSAADMVLLVKALPNIGKNLAKLGKNVGDDVAEEAIEKTVKKEAAEEMADTAEDLSQKNININTPESEVLKIGSEVINSTSNNIKNVVNTHGLRNDLPLTSSQIEELKDYAKKLGFPEDKIYIADKVTSSNTGMLYDEILLINNDVLPTTLPTRNPNSLVSGRGTIAHEIIGHYETAIKGTAFNQYDIVNNKLVRNSYNAALDEAQASIRAARFAPDLTYEERIILIKDALQRLKKEGLRINDVRHLLDILER